jgi:hypothetical protein
VRTGSSRFINLSAVAGLVLGHFLAYLAFIPNRVLRDLALSASGHAYWAFGVVTAVVVAAVSAATLVTRHFRAALAGCSVDFPAYRPLAGRLIVTQIAGFAALEAAERLLSGHGLAQILDAQFLSIGFLSQVLVALGLAVLLRWLARAAQVVGELLRSARLPRLSTSVFPRCTNEICLGRICEVSRGRGPPLLSATI